MNLLLQIYTTFLFLFQSWSFAKEKEKNYKNIFLPKQGLVLQTHMYLLSILSVPVELFTRVNGITYMPVLKHLQG